MYYKITTCRLLSYFPHRRHGCRLPGATNLRDLRRRLQENRRALLWRVVIFPEGKLT
jgi:hypothetical protein